MLLKRGEPGRLAFCIFGLLEVSQLSVTMYSGLGEARMLQAGCNGMQVGVLGDIVTWAPAGTSPKEVDIGSGQRKCLERAAYGPPFFVCVIHKKPAQALALKR